MPATETARLALELEISDLKKKLKEASGVSEDEFRKISKALDKELKAQTAAAKRNAAAQRKAMRDVEKAAGAVTSAVNKTALAFGAMGVTAAAAIGAASAAIGSDFEAQIARVSALTGTTGEDLALMEQKARDMGKATLFSATQAAQGLEELAKAGLGAEGSIAALDSVLLLAGAQSREIAEAADLTTSVLKQFRLEAGEAGRVTDVLSKAMSTSKLDFDRVNEALKVGGPIAKAFGMSLEETAGAMAALGELGLEGSTIGTAFRQTMAALANTTPKAEAALASLGLTIEELDPKTHSFGEIIQTLSEHNLTATESFQIFGKRAAGAVVSLSDALREGKKDSIAFTEELEGAIGSTADAYSIILDTVKAKGQIVISAFQDLMIETFSTYAEPLAELLDQIPVLLGEMSSAIGKSSGEIKTLARDALGDLTTWIREDGPMFARDFADAAVAVAKVSAKLAKMAPYLDDIAILVGTAFAAQKIYAFTTAIGAAATALKTLGAAGLTAQAGLGPVGVAMAAVAAATASATLLFRKLNDEITEQERGKAPSEWVEIYTRRANESEEAISKMGAQIWKLQNQKVGIVDKRHIEVLEERIDAEKETLRWTMERLDQAELAVEAMAAEEAAIKALADAAAKAAGTGLPGMPEGDEPAAPAGDGGAAAEEAAEAAIAAEEARRDAVLGIIAEIERAREDAVLAQLDGIDRIRADEDRALAELEANFAAARELAGRNIEERLAAERAFGEAKLAITRQFDALEAEEAAESRAMELEAHQEHVSQLVAAAEFAYETLSTAAANYAAAEFAERSALITKLEAKLEQFGDQMTNSQKAQLESRIAEEKKAAKKTAKIQKGLALFDIAIKAAQGIMAVWAEWGGLPFVAAGLTAAVATAAGIEAAIVANQKIEFHRGGVVPVDALPGEAFLQRQTVQNLGGERAVNEMNQTGRVPMPSVELRIGRHEAREIIRTDVRSRGLVTQEIGRATRTQGTAGLSTLPVLA